MMRCGKGARLKVTSSASAIWSSTLLNKRKKPIWWSSRLHHLTVSAAEQAFPDEVCGLFFVKKRNVHLHCFEAFTGPWFCSAKPQSVIEFVYALDDSGGRVIGTFHTHPLGDASFSKRDLLLADWANTHLVLS